MSILVIAEHNNSSLSAETAKVVNCAAQIAQQTNADIDVLIAGYQCEALASEVAAITDVNKVIVINNASLEHQLPEPLSQVIVKIAGNYSHVLASAQSTGKDVMPRVAAQLDVTQISDIISVESDDTFVRPIYAGNALATVKSLDIKKVITVRSSAFEANAKTESQVETITDTDTEVTDNTLSSHISYEIVKSARPDLTSANVVISGGRGMQNGENFFLLEALADKLDGAIGASRAAVDAGFVSNDLQVGQTGKIVAPQLYIAVGISGAIQHLAGMKDSKVIVAINKDPDAPIFQAADYGLVADLFDVLPELTEKISA